MDLLTFTAHRKQSQSWSLAAATVIESELRFLQRLPQEKGIDVVLSVDFVRLVIQGVNGWTKQTTSPWRITPSISERGRRSQWE